MRIAGRLTAISLMLLAAAGCGYETAASPPAVSAARPDVPQGDAAPGLSPSQENVASVDFSPPVEPASVETPAHNSDPEADELEAQPALNPQAEQAAAPATPVPRGKAPRADRTPRRPGEAEKILFEDLFLNMPADVVFRPFMLSDRARELDGERVSIIGFMHAGASGKGIKEFVLLKNTECKFGPGGQADHLAQVFLREGHTTQFTPDSFKVEGTLKIEPYQGPDGNTWSIYRLEDAVIR